ncbi:MAG TPA: hypothetical protein VHD95_09220 [Rhizomicrobium sp.]|nr:hypothetical protein [Rhizomicrobium sp.]
MNVPAYDPQNPAVDCRAAWRLKDSRIEGDALKFWEANGMLPPNAAVEDRLAQICAGAYDGDEMVAVATAAIREVDFLRSKLAMFRCSVSRTSRLKRISTTISLFSFDLLEQWSKENPEEQVMGIGAVIQSRGLVEHDNHAVWPDTKLTFVGYTKEGYQFRVRWFAHGTIPRLWPGDPAMGAVPARDA